MNITLALGGGGVKGFAHIGLLRVLEAEGFHIRGIAGTSVGGLVGALYASGYSPDEIEARLTEIDQGNLFTRMHGDGPALLGFSGLIDILSQLLGERTFKDLRVPFVATATDLTDGLPVVIREGRLLDAVLASSAVPGVFPSVSRDGHQLVDGAVTSPIPVAEARALYPQAPVVAVLLTPKLGWRGNINQEEARRMPFLMTNLPLVYRLAGRMRLAQAFDIFLQSMDLTGLMLVDQQLKLEKPEVIIRPNIGRIGMVDHVDGCVIAKLGEVAAKEALPAIRKAVRWNNRIRLKLESYILPRRRRHNGS